MNALEDLNLSEKKAYAELKRRVHNEVSPELKNDAYLYLRYLRARDFNIDLAETMLRNHFSWRRANQIENISSYVPEEVAHKYFPLERFGFDKDGAPVHYFSFGNMDTKGMLKSAKRSTLVKTLVQRFEEDVVVMKEQSKKLQKPIEQWTYIFDFEDYSFARATHKPSLDLFIELFMIYEANYPERLKAAFLINASIYFTIAFAVVKPLLSGATLKKIKIYGKDGWKADILKAVEADVLPAFLGGKRTDPDGNPLCNTIVKHATTVPESYYLTKTIQRLKGKPGVRKLVVSRMSKVPLVLEVQKIGSNIEWEFETESRDISFGLFYKECADNKTPSVELIPKQRIDTNLTSEVGMYKCDRPGIYILMFDNSYSWIYQKEIYCKVEVVCPIGTGTKIINVN